jgi:asparagine synthase (glutamine-hydrolysing)
MSGFAGIIRFEGTPEQTATDERSIEKMARTIAFRGPDAAQSWQHPGAHFCFSLHKTNPTTQAKAQPCSLDGRIWLLGEVRLDGRDDLTRRFAQRGEKLASAVTDEELVLHTLHAFGEKGVAELDGDYAFVLWDAKKRKLTGFRDLTGSRPFFYLAKDGLICFGNTLESMCEAPGFDGKLDERLLADYLLISWCPDPERTVYEQVRRLAPGFSIEFSHEGVQLRRVAQLPIEEALHYKKDEDYVEHYREILHQAVRDRLTGETNSIFLSGGLDSTTVAAEATRICKTLSGTCRTSAQTIDYKPLFDDKEGEEAQRVANYLELPIELFHGGDRVPFSGWDEAGFPLPEPKHEPFQALHVEKYRRVAQSGACVVLSGDGGDDILLGQAGPYLLNLLRHGKFVSAAAQLTRHIWNTGNLPVLGLGIRSGISARFGRKTSDEMAPAWLCPEFVERLDLRGRLREATKKPHSEHPTHPWAYAMLSGPFWPSVLEGEDAAWSGVPVEARAPLLDRRMTRFLLRLPVIPWCMDKHLVRRAMAGRLPNETLSRPKAPLAEDPVLLHIRKKQWKPEVPAKLSPVILEMIDRGRLATSLQDGQTDESLSFLRPISLDRWLKSIEKKRSIQ